MYHLTSATCCKDRGLKKNIENVNKRKQDWTLLKWYATMNPCTISHLSRVVKTIRESGEKPKDRRGGGGGGIFAHMVLTAMPQVQCPFDCNFYLQEVRRHIWNELGVDHCSVLLLTSTAHWATHQSRGEKRA